MDAVVSRVEGIVLAYDRGAGLLLLKHKSDASLRDVAARYSCSKTDEGFWFASFRWSALTELSQKSIIAASKGWKTRLVIVGRPAICSLKKDPKWKAVELTVDLAGEKFDLRLRPRRMSSEKKSRESSKNKKKRVANFGFARTHIEAPPIGNGKVNRAVGGKKPGSHRS